MILNQDRSLEESTPWLISSAVLSFTLTSETLNDFWSDKNMLCPQTTKNVGCMYIFKR